jgi:redox-sensitive bicupin YhaK (pirin superfamily)
MTAGKGVQHSEMFPLLKENEDNPLELFQIWLNLPKSKKNVDPHFAMLWNEDIPVYKHKDENGKITSIEIIAGEVDGNKAPDPAPNSWAADTDNEVAIWHFKMEPGAKWELPKASKGINRSLYFFKGNGLTINDDEIPAYRGVVMDPSEQAVLQNGNEESHLLILQGKPIDEPVVQHGPFVVNDHKEINETIMEFQRTQFGGWPWPTHENTHAKERGRFAIYADGTEVLKD